jgi:twitching motility protein PilT
MSSVIDQICAAAVAHRAQDLFLKPNECPSARIDGQIYRLTDDILTNEALGEFWVGCGCDPGTTTERDVRWMSPDGHWFRVNLFRHLGRLGAALRPIKAEVGTLEELGLPAERLRDWCSRDGGLILVTGATNSGKSTTLAACLNWINHHRQLHIVTIEDPIEYVLKPAQSLITQREVGGDTDSFVAGLRSALRQSPDIIMLGEIRDAHTARVALQACETGHLVLTTLHSADVAETVERLTALFPPDERESALLVLSKQLIGILCQKLLPARGGGLHVVGEHLANSGAVRKWLREGRGLEIIDFMARNQESENLTFAQSITAAYRAGVLDRDTARAAFANPQEFDRMEMGISSGSRS